MMTSTSSGQFQGRHLLAGHADELSRFMGHGPKFFGLYILPEFEGDTQYMETMNQLIEPAERMMHKQGL